MGPRLLVLLGFSIVNRFSQLLSLMSESGT